MKAVILAGGYGTRISEETDNIPKPMIRIGHQPILWHIMKHYAYFGYKDFYLALGYKAEIIKAVKKLNWIEFFTINKNDFLFLLPIVKPTIPSVEKAKASKKNAAIIINCIKMVLTAR